MDLRRIRHFNELAETLNFSRAAERLYIAQPALSVSIQKLERELGTKLFARTSSGVTLTASGSAVLFQARRVLYHGEQMFRAARNATAGTSGLLRIGFVGSATYHVIPTVIPAFRNQYPGVELVLSEAASGRLLSLLREDALDVCIVRTPLLQSHAATLHGIQRDRWLAVFPAGHRLADAAHVRLADLAGEPFVMYSATDAAGMHASAMAVCQAAGFVPEVKQEATQISTLLALVASGLGVALVPEVARGTREAQVVYRTLQDAPALVETGLALAYQSGTESPASHRFIELVRQLLPG
jgi:DNA-binding transcriptional LysR family regulator